jgi:cellulose synthase/poly-beta-1,6-N-acetylglucosamine synthase-like glycosyltransferase
MTRERPGVSFVVPVRNGEEWLAAALDSILAQADGRSMEIIVVEDGSTDRSPEILRRYAASAGVTVVPGPRRGAAAALNAGIRQAANPIICQVDQDVILHAGWLTRLTAALQDPRVAAAQGYYDTARDASTWARVMGLDLEARYRRMLGREVDHVCTGNTAYRAEALRAVGAFDEALGYGYDNDISYRLVDAGHRLVICPDARSTHKWRDGWRTYLIQQYGFGYGRIDLVAKHRHRVGGDDLSRLPMMLHAPAMAAALGLAVIAAVLRAAGVNATVPALLAAMLLVGLVTERLIAGGRAAITFGDRAGWAFVPVHLARDLAWVAALAIWSVRRLRGVTSHPSHSMRPRAAVNAPRGER